MSAATVSVVIPTVGRSPQLCDVLAALDAQTGVDRGAMEVIVVGDGIGTKALEYLRPSEHDYGLRVVAILHAGTPAARDAGWRASQCPLLIFLDDDVVPTSRLVSEHLDAQRAHGPCVVLGRVQPPSGRRKPWSAYDDRVMEKKYRRLDHVEIPAGIHYGGNVSLPRELMEEVGGHDHVLQQDGDVELGDRLLARGARFLYWPSALGVHHGSLDYAAWRQRHFLHGRWEVALRRDRGVSGGLPGLLACYYDRHPLNRLAIRLGLGRRTAREGGFADWAAAIGGVAYHLRLHRVSYPAFSCAANLLYWSGVRDAMRGNAAFWTAVHAVRRHQGRPYRTRERRQEKTA